DRNNRDSTMSAMSSSTSAMPVFKHPSLNITLDPMPEDQISFRSDSSAVSGDSCVLPPSFHRNKDLVRLVGNAPLDAQNWGDGISFTTESISSEDSSSHLGSAASLCTPARDFKRGKSNRGSARSMPPESELIRGLCNSAIRRTFSSVSDSIASPQRFTRERSMRLREKLLLSASMAELPEEEVAILKAWYGQLSVLNRGYSVQRNEETAILLPFLSARLNLQPLRMEQRLLGEPCVDHRLAHQVFKRESLQL
ncbi:hypothetical protein ANCDUO_15088, partial [Ancylostoma duodenale]